MKSVLKDGDSQNVEMGRKCIAGKANSRSRIWELGKAQSFRGSKHFEPARFLGWTLWGDEWNSTQQGDPALERSGGERTVKCTV